MGGWGESDEETYYDREFIRLSTWIEGVRIDGDGDEEAVVVGRFSHQM